MKTLVSLLALLTTISALASPLAKITCEATKSAPRPESIQKLVYALNLQTGVPALGCQGGADEHDFCASIRMDLSHPMSTLETDCRDRSGVKSVVYRFFLAQEDEFENLVEINVRKSCATGRIQPDASLRARIVSYTSGSFNESTGTFMGNSIGDEVVNCSTLLPNGPRK